MAHQQVILPSRFTGTGVARLSPSGLPAVRAPPRRRTKNLPVARAEKEPAKEARPSQRSEPSAAFILATAALLSAGAAQADELDTVDSAIGTLIDAVKAAGGFVKTGVQYAGVGAQYAKDAYDKVAPVVKDAAEVASPYVQSATKAAGEVAGPALKAAVPVVKNGLGEAEKFLAAQGVNPKVILEGAKQATTTAESAITQATPVVTSTVNTISATSPEVLAQYAGGALALYLLVPPLVRSLFGGLRGYRGDITPASALDLVTSDGGVVVIDLRSDREKEVAGVPELPSGRSCVELEYVSISDRKIRGQLRNPGALETTVTALEIAQLKKVSKGTTILLLDKSGGQSKAVAKELTAKGFRKVYVVSGGFNTWTSSKLSTRVSSSVNSPEILAPVFGTFRTVSGNGRSAKVGGSNKIKSLPSGR